MINTATASNGSRDDFSVAYVIGLNVSALASWSLFLKSTPKYVDGGKTLNKKVNPKWHLIKISRFLGWRLRA